MIPVVVGSNPIGHPKLSQPSAAFRAAAQAALAQIESHARGVLVSDDAEHLHQLRVGLRKLRAALRAFRRILVKEDARRVSDTLRKLSPKLGAARDWDVQVGRMAANDDKLLAEARVRQEKARRRARRALVSKRFAAIGPAVRRLSPADTREDLRQFGAAALKREHRRLLDDAGGVDWADPKARHGVRIRVKRLRYSCEFFAPAFPNAGAEPYIGALKELQDIFGELNDIAVGRRLLGVRGDESALLRRLGPAWAAFEKRRPFWHAAG